MVYQPNHIDFQLPEWVEDFTAQYIPTDSAEKKMEFVISASWRNVTEKTGGPFAAAIFATDSGELISLGVNLVTNQRLSILHAEIVAITLAQRKAGSYDLGASGMPTHELYASTEPCVMCLGAILWSGVRHVVTGASDADARAIGFDEGPKPEDWIHELKKRKITVSTCLNREKARNVLQYYSQIGGTIYNSREG